MKKIKKKIDIVSFIIVALIVILLFAIGLPVVRHFQESENIKNENEALRDEYLIDNFVNFEELKGINPDICAWIKIDNTRINFPVVQGTNNLEYLNKNAYGDEAIYGSIFIDSRNKNDFSDTYTLFYGHHMNDGNMLGDLDLFENEGFFDKNQTGELFTSDKKYSLKILAYIVVNQTDDFIFDPEQWNEENEEELIDYVKENADCLDDEVNWDSNNVKEKFLALSTCSSKAEDKRSVLILEVEN